MKNLELIKIVRKGSKGKPTKGLFKCYCGNEFEAIKYDVERGHTKSCGCLLKTTGYNLGKNNLKHGDGNGKHYLYSIWYNILQRCHKNPELKQWKDYGGRGIEMCSEWRNDYLKFKKWVLENIGERQKGMTLDRIDNNGNYEPNNVEWASRKKQNNNKRSNKLKYLDINEIKSKYKNNKITQCELANIYNISQSSISKILKK